MVYLKDFFGKKQKTEKKRKKKRARRYRENKNKQTKYKITHTIKPLRKNHDTTETFS